MNSQSFKFIIVSVFAMIFVACAGNNQPVSEQTKVAANKNTSISSMGNAATTKSDDETPASVKAVFADAQSFTKQHKDLSKEQITEIEKDTGGKVPDTDHHSYLAFATENGVRKQVGAATLLKTDGKDVIVVYENKDGMPDIKAVRAENVPATFLSQFNGKGHDDKFQIGADLKPNGADEQTAKAIAQAVKVDAVTMQTLYGAAHKH